MFVHEVIAAITIDPSFISKSFPDTLYDCSLFLFLTSFKFFSNEFFALLSNTLSWGLFGPDIVETITDQRQADHLMKGGDVQGASDVQKRNLETQRVLQYGGSR